LANFVQKQYANFGIEPQEAALHSSFFQATKSARGRQPTPTPDQHLPGPDHGRLLPGLVAHGFVQRLF